MASRFDPTSVLDVALNAIRNGATEIHICSAEPTNFANVATVTLGKNTFTPPAALSAPANGTPAGSRKLTTTALSGTNATASGTATHWAIVSGTVLYSVGALAASQAVTSGNPFTLTAFDLTLQGQ